MAIVSDVEIRLRADIARLQQDLTRARQQVSNFTDGVKSMVGNLFGGFAIGTVIAQVVGAQREFDKLSASLETVTGSQKEAGKALAAIQKLAAQTPFDLAQVTEGFLKLRNMGLTPSERAIMSYGNTAAAMGKNLNQMIEAVADATTGEFERLKEFGIKAKQNGDQVSLTFQGTTKTIGNNAAEIEDYLLKIGEVQFAGGMERQAATLDGALSNLADTFKTTLVAFSSGSGFGSFVHSSVLALIESLADLGAMFQAISGEAEKEGEKVKALGPLHAFLTTTFEALTVVGTNIAYVFKTIGKDIGAFAAQAVTLFNGGFKGLTDGTTVKAIKAIGNARVEEAKRERAEVDAASVRILEAAGKRQEAERKADEERKKGVADALAGYKIQAEGVKGLTDAQKKAADAAAKEAARRLQAYKELESQVQERVDSTAREVAGLAELTEAEKFDIKLTEELRLGKRQLTKEQEARIRALNAEAGANAVLAKSQKEYDDLLQRMADAARDAALERERMINSAREEAEQNEFLVETFGQSEAAIIRLRAARLLEQEAQRLGRELTEEEIADLKRVIELKNRSAQAVADRAALEQQRTFWTDIEQTARDTFLSIADGGKDLGKRLKDTLKNTFFDWLYQQTLKKWIINIGTSVSGAGAVSGIANAAGVAGGASGGAGGILGTVGNLYSALSGGMTLGGGLGTGFLGSLAGGLNGAGIGSGLTSAMGLQMGNAMAGVLGPAVSGAISSGLGALAAAAPWVAGAVALFSVAKKAFGHGPKEYTGNSTLSGWIGGNGTLDAKVFAEWTKKGGWFSSSKSGSDPMAVDAEMAKGLVSTYEAIKVSTMDYAKVLGLNADFIATRAQDLNIKLGKDQAANQAAIAQFFSDAADNVAREVLPSMSLFQRAGETAAQTLQRMAVNASGVEQVFNALGVSTVKVFGEVGNASMLARERLVELAGGVENLASMAGYFQQNILTEADRAQIAMKPLAEALDSLGYSSLKTTDQYKAAVLQLVESGALATEEGAKQYAGLLALAPQFKLVADYLAQLEQAAADKAAAELAQQERDLAEARERVAAALEDNAQFLTNLVDDALSAVGRAVDAQKDRVTKAYQESMRALEADIARVNDTIARTGALSKALKGAAVAAGSDSYARVQAGRAEISAALAIAKAGGVLPSVDDLAAALSAVGADSADNYATAAEYQRAVARTNAELEALGGLTDDQLGTAERQLQVLQDQKTAAERAHEAELARLDAIAEFARNQVDMLRGISNTAQSVDNALVDLSRALSAAARGPTPTNPGNVAAGLSYERMYQDVLGRAPDAAGLAFWQKVFGDVIDSEEYMQFVKSAQAELSGPPVVQPTAQSGTMGGSSAMLDELRTLNTRMASVEANMANTAKATDLFANQFNQVSGGGNALAVEGY